MSKTRWREHQTMDAKDCKHGCCKTSLSICYSKYLCRCHLPVDVSAVKR